MELRRFLAGRLPEPMLPATFVALPALRRTPSGKLDRRSLPAPERPGRNLPPDGAGPPLTAAEATLARIWSEVLGAERVGAGDSFFALGGDSMLSLQVAARAAEAGLHITPRQVMEHPTLAELAAVARESAEAAAGGAATAGPVPLTPVQADLLSRDLADPHHWNMSILLAPRPGRLGIGDEERRAATPGVAQAARGPAARAALAGTEPRASTPLDARRVEQCLAVLLARHDALRLARGPAGWRQRVAAAGGEVPLAWIDLAGLPPAAAEAAFVAAATALQGSLDLARGPLAAALFDRGLLLVVHHLAIDAVSWRVLLEDFERAWRQLDAGGEVRLPPPSTSFKRWAERLSEWARSPAAEREIAYWAALAARLPHPASLPADDPGGAGTEAAARIATAALEPTSTRAFLRDAHAAYQTRPDELLLAALAEALATWTGERAVWIAVEGHGREAPFADVDLTRTVGWLTSVHPVLLDLREAADAAEVVRAVKEQLRRAPHRGLGHGALRWCRDDDVAAPLSRLPRPQVSFNYLGQLDRLLGGSSLVVPDLEPPGPQRSPRAELPYLLEVNAWVRDGRLTVAVVHSGRHRPATAARLARQVLAVLRRLTDHCLSPGAGGRTPSDFPAADLDQRGLDRLLQKFAQPGGVAP